MARWHNLLAIAFALSCSSPEPLRVVATPSERSSESIIESCNLLPVFQDGEAVAYLVAEIDPTSFLYRIGLRAGDRIVQANGRPIGPDLLGAELIELIAEAPKLSLDLESSDLTPRVILVEFETP